jgi:hypothetical protein
MARLKEGMNEAFSRSWQRAIGDEVEVAYNEDDRPREEEEGKLVVQEATTATTGVKVQKEGWKFQNASAPIAGALRFWLFYASYSVPYQMAVGPSGPEWTRIAAGCKFKICTCFDSRLIP